MQSFLDKDGKLILEYMVEAVQQNKSYLGEVDGLIGDGDHGANMNKGFSVFWRKFGKENLSFSEGLQELSMILMNEIGGSMGPIYGTVFSAMADELESAGRQEISQQIFTDSLGEGLAALYEIVEARQGDKTLIDALKPAVDALNEALEKEEKFDTALESMKKAAEEGKEKTKEMIAKYGRSSRLGERSRGVLDAGACSCCLILKAMADGIIELVSEEKRL